MEDLEVVDISLQADKKDKDRKPLTANHLCNRLKTSIRDSNFSKQHIEFLWLSMYSGLL